jgi:hypothetical protein
MYNPKRDPSIGVDAYNIWIKSKSQWSICREVNDQLEYLPDLVVFLPQLTNSVVVADPSTNDPGRDLVQFLLQTPIGKEDHLSLQ